MVNGAPDAPKRAIRLRDGWTVVHNDSFLTLERKTAEKPDLRGTGGGKKADDKSSLGRDLDRARFRPNRDSRFLAERGREPSRHRGSGPLSGAPRQGSAGQFQTIRAPFSRL